MQRDAGMAVPYGVMFVETRHDWELKLGRVFLHCHGVAVMSSIR